MKNREKYAEEIKDYKGHSFCDDFVIPVIFKGCECSSSCERCRMLQAFWLEEEYIEPEVDWTKVAVDTPILVKDIKSGTWNRRYFAKFEDGKVYVWWDGRTSWTAEDSYSMNSWNYAKLAEQEVSDE